MATKHVGIKGTYEKTVEDSNTQASNKFTKSYPKPTDDMEKPSHHSPAPKDSGGESSAY